MEYPPPPQWAVELYPGAWLMERTCGGKPVVTFDAKAAARRDSKRAALRMLQKARRRCGKSFPRAMIQEAP